MGFLSGYDSGVGTVEPGAHSACPTAPFFPPPCVCTHTHARVHTHRHAHPPTSHRLTLRFIRVAPTPWGQLLTHHPCYPQAPLHPGRPVGPLGSPRPLTTVSQRCVWGGTQPGTVESSPSDSQGGEPPDETALRPESGVFRTDGSRWALSAGRSRQRC